MPGPVDKESEIAFKPTTIALDPMDGVLDEVERTVVQTEDVVLVEMPGEGPRGIKLSGHDSRVDDCRMS